MPIQLHVISETFSGPLAIDGDFVFSIPQFDASLGTLTGVRFDLDGDFGGLITVESVLGQLPPSTVDISVEATLEPGNDAPDFGRVTATGSDGETVSLLGAAALVVPVDGTLFGGSVSLDSVTGFTGDGTYNVLAGYDVDLGGMTLPNAVSGTVDAEIDVVYTYLTPEDDGGEDSTPPTDRPEEDPTDPDGFQRLFVTSVIPTAAPVVTDAASTFTFALQQFDPIYGTLLAANVSFFGDVSTIFDVAQPTSGQSGGAGSATVSVDALFEDAPGGPTMPDADFSLDVTGSWGATSNPELPLFTSGASDPVALGNITGAVGTGTFDIDASYIGDFTSSAAGTLSEEAFVYGVQVEYIFDAGPSGVPIFMSDGDDTMAGTPLADFFDGRRGDDTLSGAGGDDLLIGGAGADRLNGDLGNDQIYGGTQSDTIYGGDGNDQVWGGRGRDTVYLEQGNDIFFDENQAGPNGSDTVFGGAGNDRIEGGKGDDAFYGGTGVDVIYGRQGNDRLYGGGNSDTLHGGLGDDIVTGGKGRDLVYLNAGDDTYIDNAQGGVLGVDRVFGGDGADTIKGGNGDDAFYGGNGADLIFGRTGNDSIYGGAQADVIRAGLGDDLVFGGPGQDVIDLSAGNDRYVDTAQRGVLGQDRISGGSGADSFVFRAKMSADIITDFKSGTDSLHFTQATWRGTLTNTQVVDRFASVEDGNIVFDFGNERSVTLLGLTSLAGLENDLVLT